LKEQEQLEAVLRSTHLGAFVTDEKQNILFVNEALCKMLGLKAKDTIGRPLCSILSGEGEKKLGSGRNGTRIGVSEKVEEVV
jgi:PAS domain S-box-containing protein